MSGWVLCFYPPFIGSEDAFRATIHRKICIEIPLVIPPRKFPHVPERWWTVGEKAVDVAQDLQLLASIASLARDLSPEFARPVQAGIEQAAHSMKEKLPEGVELHLGEQTAK